MRKVILLAFLSFLCFFFCAFCVPLRHHPLHYIAIEL
jgi:hypothetical protein